MYLLRINSLDLPLYVSLFVLSYHLSLDVFLFDCMAVSVVIYLLACLEHIYTCMSFSVSVCLCFYACLTIT